MSRLLYRSEGPSFVQCDREGNLRKRIDRVKINSRDLCGINVQSDIADEVLGERRMLAAAPDRDCDIKPLASFDGIRSNDFRRVLGIERFARLLELRSELFCLSRPDRLRRQSTADELSQSETKHYHAAFEPLLVTATHFRFPPVIDRCCAFYDPLQRRTS